jgi:DNA mismatch endonuclease, patch repair protein
MEGLHRRADILFNGHRIAIFIDGCFWHGCSKHGTWPKNNADFWRNKIEANKSRDRDTDKRLRSGGWTVLRIWEHEEPSVAAKKIENIVRNR